MRDRILALIDFYGITRTEFANRIGVTKGAVSHIVSANGRGGELKETNIARILSAFPEVNRSWLTMGEGNMINRTEPQQQSIFDVAAQQQHSENKVITAHQPSENKKDSSKTNSKQYSTEQSNSSDYSLNNSAEKPTVERHNIIKETPLSEQKQSNYAQNVLNEPSTPYYIAYNPHQEPVIERIVIFYTDGTFTQHRPRKASEAK